MSCRGSVAFSNDPFEPREMNMTDTQDSEGSLLNPDDQQNYHLQQPEMPPAPSAGGLLHVAKTWMDPEACKKVLIQLIARTETRLKDQPSVQLKPLTPIEGFKNASPCPSSWLEMQGTEQVRFCQRCYLYTYDFSSLDKAQAQELVFQREGRLNTLFYRRLDGKFLTQDCPIGARQRLVLVIAVMTAILVVGGLLTMLMLFPQPPQSKPAETSIPIQAPTYSSPPGKSSPVLNFTAAPKKIHIQNMAPPPGAQ